MNKSIPDQAPPAYEEAKLYRIPHRSTAFHSLTIPLFTMAQLRCQSNDTREWLHDRIEQRFTQIGGLLSITADNKYLTQQLELEYELCINMMTDIGLMRFGVPPRFSDFE
jgi:hypothetical protein